MSVESMPLLRQASEHGFDTRQSVVVVGRQSIFVSSVSAKCSEGEELLSRNV